MKKFFTLSRTMHGILDLAAPGFAALLWLGDFPHWQIILLSIFTAFAAYTAIYTLNDLVGIAVDREKFTEGGINEGYSVEASDMRYPLAQNILSYRSGMIWFAFWFALALVGSYLLNPAIVIILITATVLEVIYCLLLKVTYWRTLISGLVKMSGPIAAVFVVDTILHPTSCYSYLFGSSFGRLVDKMCQRIGTIQLKINASAQKPSPFNLDLKKRGWSFS